ncbi:MAG TPA: hypothetical protein VM287_16230 [Egibacteraceae bacterium]|jgi:hypothetical protein|nr:hypothetical protein [Egibacteraceae bacterium]
MADKPMKPDDERHGKVPILIDGQKIHAPRGSLLGSQLRTLTNPPIGADRDLWLDVEGDLDDLVEDTEVVELRPQMRFFTVPKVINPGSSDRC